MTELVKFICPECGAEWYEEQDTEDDWFRLATRQTLCESCGNKVIQKILEEERNYAST